VGGWVQNFCGHMPGESVIESLPFL